MDGTRASLRSRAPYAGVAHLAGHVAWAATGLGRLALWAAAALLLPSGLRLLVLPLFALALVFPARRIDFLALGALGVAYIHLPKPARAGPLTEAAGILLMLAIV